ncbi:MAG: tRNA (N(6)-L-threonylcarbamoyladenosine(37)-C(2))-methylthiotransferase MtaB [Planctomycetota bacterium]
MPTFKTLTLGCKVNQYETEYVCEGFRRLGYREAEDGEPADLCLVNTCTVTAEGDLKSRKVIRQLARQNPQAQIVVMGCYATRAPEVVAALPGVVEVVTDKRKLPELLARFGLVDLPDGISSFGRRHRAYVKVQDGCRMPCSYCIIPKVRPVLASRPVDDVLGEIRRLVDHGHREIVLTGIHLGHYGVDLAERESSSRPVDLASLLGRIMRLEGPFRVRISSIEAVEVIPELIALMADHADRICPHLHLSMQSGSDAVLGRMRRRWASGRFAERCHAIRESLDHPALTTDVIVGFPGETEADFEATCRAVEEVEFSKLHVFRFSPREGTPAAEMPDQVPDNVKKHRAAELGEIGRHLRRRFLESLAGRALQVLVETPVQGRPGSLAGTSARYAPVELSGGEDRLGQLVRVTAGPVADGRIRAANWECVNTSGPSAPDP